MTGVAPTQVSEPSQAGGWFSWGGSKPAKPNPHTMHSEARDGKILQIRDRIRSGQEVNVHDFVGASVACATPTQLKSTSLTMALPISEGC